MNKLALFVALACVALAPRPVSAADAIKVGMLRLPTALFIGIDQGYFAAEGIDVKPVFFRSGAELVPALSTGQIDVATTSPGAALFNAMALGVNATIVADYWTSNKDVPSGDSAYIMVRKDLAPYGTFKPRDAKNLTMAVTARGQMTELFADAYLASAGVSRNDVNIVDMPLPDMNAALQNHAIDLASTIDPYATMLVSQGAAVKAMNLSTLMPGYVQAVMMYGQRVGKTDRPLGERFLRAFAKANTFLRAHLTTPAGRTAIAQIYQKFIPLDDPTLYTKIGLAVGPAKLDVAIDGKYALRWQMDQYVKQGLVKTAPDLTKFVDNTFAEAASRAK
ncbi:MAG TPA: ABC transporter substrate-binding protein [Candidatus Lustribacter sp.]